MEKNVKVINPRYQQVAEDIAAKIVDKHYQIGDKMYARSLIASQYAVSSETARRAIAILSDMGIVETTKGSGVVIKSYENALLFVSRCRASNTLTELKRNAERQAEDLARESLKLKEMVAHLVDRTDQFRFTNPFIPYELTVELGSACIGRSISELNFWQNTTATVIAIRRDNMLTLSPGPYEVLREEDNLFFIGDENCLERVSHFLREPGERTAQPTADAGHDE